MKNNILPYKKYLYIYQLLEYNQALFLEKTFHDLGQFRIWQGQRTKSSLVYTKKIKVIFIFSIFLQLIPLLFLIEHYSFIWIIILIPILYLTPLYILIASCVLYPFEYISKRRIVQKAHHIVRQNPNLKIIGVTGCYGKTSTMSFLSTLLQGDYTICMPQSGYNTLLGISQEIIKKLKTDTEILLIELGDYKRGEIEEICQNFPPDIAIITSIGSQHLERFKTMENLILAKAEIITASKEHADIILPSYVYDMPLIPKLKDKTYHISTVEITDIANLKTYLTLDTVLYHAHLLGTHIIADLGLAIQCAQLLHVSDIQSKISLLKPVDRRMSPSQVEGNLYIDDTYNIGVESARSAVEFLELLKAKHIYSHIVVCTGGIVEQGTLSKQRNTEYGKLLDRVADTIVIFNTPYRLDLERGITKKQYIELDGYKEFYEYSRNGIPQDSVILLQNEIPDEYYI